MKLASLCVGYLSLPGFDLRLTDTDIKRLIEGGYYTLVDYAARHWLDHLQEGLKHIIDRVSVLSLIGNISKFLESHYRKPQSRVETAYTMRRVVNRIQEYGVCYNSEQIFDVLIATQQQFDSYGVAFASNDALDMLDVISRIRALFEDLVSDTRDVHQDCQGVDRLKMLKYFYGDRPFKCPRMSCEFFHRGFSTPEQRDAHISKHDRPYGCSYPGRFRSTLRFCSERELRKHISQAHDRAEREERSFPSKRKKLALQCGCCQQ